MFVIDLTYLKFESGYWLESYHRLKGSSVLGFPWYSRKSQSLASSFIIMINIASQLGGACARSRARGFARRKFRRGSYKLRDEYVLIFFRLILNELYLRLKAKFAKLASAIELISRWIFLDISLVTLIDIRVLFACIELCREKARD